MLPEASEEVIVLGTIETTPLGGREGPLLQPSSARGEVTMHARQGQPQPMDPSRQRQRKRYQAAQRSRNRRVHALYDRIFRPDMRWRAWREVRAQGGRAGVDGVRIDDLAQQGREALLQALEQDLRAGSYRPPPVRRGSSPKPDGRQRPRGIPTVRARVVQPACTIVVAPLCEANFQDTSYGCRPTRSATQAVKVIKAQLGSHG
jgi:retron-type reverse transcriptase